VFQAAHCPRQGGKSGGLRRIILFRIGGHCCFAHGFAKIGTANVSATELKALKLLVNVLRFSDAQCQASTPCSASRELCVRNLMLCETRC
jgi:hypothetical protein